MTPAERAHQLEVIGKLMGKKISVIEPPAFIQPQEITTVWRDGTVIKETPGKRAKVLPSIDPIFDDHS